MKNTSEPNSLKWEDPESSFWKYGTICEHDTNFACEDRLKLILSQQKEEFKKMCEGIKVRPNYFEDIGKEEGYNQALSDLITTLEEK